MDWATAVFAVVTVILFVQGCSILRRSQQPPHVRWFGWFTLLLANLALLSFLLFSWGLLVLSPEFGIVMVQGSLAWYGLAVLIVGTAIMAALGWHIACFGAGLPMRLPWLFGIGVIVGLMAVSRLRLLNPADLEPFRAYSYDLWWPPLLIWFSVCLVEASLTIFRFSHRAGRWWVTVVLVCFLAVYALGRPIHGDQTTKSLWGAVQVIVLPIGIILVSVGAWRLYRAWRDKTLRWPALQKPSLRQWGLFVSLLLIALSLADLFSLEKIDPILTLAIFILAWISLAELIASGPLATLVTLTVRQKLWDEQSQVRRWWAATCAWLAGIGAGIAKWRKEGASAGSWSSALLKVLVGIVLLIVLNEIPNAGKTLIEPFSVPVFFEEERKDVKYKESVHRDLGQLIAERVLSSLHLIEEELQPDVLLRSVPGGFADKDVVSFKLVSPSATATLDAALAKSSDLEIGGVKVPLSLFVAPIQMPVRGLLGVQVIRGSLHADRDRFVLLAFSTTGEVWRAEQELGGASAEAKVANLEAIANAADKLALQIASVNAPAVTPGRAPLWEAFQDFRAGLDSWNRYRGARDFSKLSEAINRFRAATRNDPSFALAHYRLGLALREDSRPGRAAEAFRESLRANPNFLAGHFALADTLYNFDQYQSAASFRHAYSASSTQVARLHDARNLWHPLIRLLSESDSQPDQGVAYHGLCLATLDYAEAKQSMNLDWQEPYYLAYFYCKRAQGLYAKLPAALRADPKIIEIEASVLNNLGTILVRNGQTATIVETTDWHCSGHSVESQPPVEGGAVTKQRIWQSPSGRAALRYYKRAKTLSPDDPVIRCNVAATAYGLGDPKPMRALESHVGTHLMLAGRYSSRAEEDEVNHAVYYGLALQEYDTAMQLDPTNVDALNGYAYTYWQWRHEWPGDKPPAGPSSDMAHTAESYARKAISLVSGKDSREEARVRSTLGEVLLAQARAQEAVGVLEQAISLPPNPEHEEWDEIRWDLAQAYLCAGSALQNAGSPDHDVRALKEKATPLFKRIRENESSRIVKRFSEDPGKLDPARVRMVCSRGKKGLHYPVERMPENGGSLYVLEGGQPLYQSYPVCSWSGILGDAENLKGEAVSNLQLHVWGGGVDKLIFVGEDPRGNIFLTDNPQNTRDYYFAQLEDAERKPVSEVYSIQTYANGPDSQCPQNLITLKFVQQR